MATFKQKKVIRILKENPTWSISRAMREAGYSSVSSVQPGILTNSIGFQQLMKKHLPDELLTKKHHQLLKKREYKRVFNHVTGEYETVKTNEIDANAVAKGLDMAYKLKGSYAPEKREVVTASLSDYLKHIATRREIASGIEKVDPERG